MPVRCPVCARLIRAVFARFSYAIVDGRSCRFESRPTENPARQYQIHKSCENRFRERIESGEECTLVKCVRCRLEGCAVLRRLPDGWRYAKLPAELESARPKLYCPQHLGSGGLVITDQEFLYDDSP
jgi:hypothetical protein